MAIHLYEVVRAEAAYKITFDDIACNAHARLAQQIAEVFETFPAGITELRLSADTGRLAVYVTIPADVMPEALDRKAHALREKWAREPRTLSE